MSTKVNIEIEQGATFVHDVEIKNTDNTAFDVTGYTGTGTLKKHYLSNTSYTFGVSLSNGECVFSMSAANTSALEEGLYVYDVIITSGNTVYRVVSGMATVTPGVS